jgi:hypothetical protein
MPGSPNGGIGMSTGAVEVNKGVSGVAMFLF